MSYQWPLPSFLRMVVNVVNTQIQVRGTRQSDVLREELKGICSVLFGIVKARFECTVMNALSARDIEITLKNKFKQAF